MESKDALGAEESDEMLARSLLSVLRRGEVRRGEVRRGEVREGKREELERRDDEVEDRLEGWREGQEEGFAAKSKR